MVLLVPDGPFRKPSQKPDFTALFRVFRNPRFRSAAFGYFGHMWELYTFWAFVPVMLVIFNGYHPGAIDNVSVTSFLIIGLGGVACVIGGYISQSWGTKRTAFTALLSSGICCLLSPLFFLYAPAPVFIGFLIFWGLVVIADSPLFSTLVAQNAPQANKGTALTIVNSIGFAITIVSIQLVERLEEITDSRFLFMVLAFGPVLGLLALNQTGSSGREASSSK